MATETSKLCNEVVGLQCSFLQLTRQSTLYAYFCLHSDCSVSALTLCNLACLPARIIYVLHVDWKQLRKLCKTVKHSL